MDEYVIVLHPNNDIVLGVNENRPEREHVIHIEERYDEDECFVLNEGQIMGITIITLMIITSSVVYA
jgi:hypothetical protein